MKGLTTLVLLVTLVFAGIASFYFLEYQKANEQVAAALDNIAQLQGELRKTESQLEQVRKEKTGSEDAIVAARAEAEKWRDEAARLAENRGRLETKVKELGAQVVASVAKDQQPLPGNVASDATPAASGPDPMAVVADALGAAEKDKRLRVDKGKAGPVITIQSRSLFGPHPAELKEEGERLLKDVVGAIRGAGSTSLRIEAHTDDVPIGPKYRDRYPTNKELSEDRARVVAGFLAAAEGVVSNRVSAAGLGDTRPIVGNDTAEGRAKNSRVEIHVTRSE